jgi:hypothetical protein
MKLAVLGTSAKTSFDALGRESAEVIAETVATYRRFSLFGVR